MDLSEANNTTETFYLKLIEGGRKPRPGDLIFSRNATVGEVAQVTNEHPLFAMGQDVCLLRKRSDAYSTGFLQWFLKSRITAQQIEESMVGSTFRRMNVQQIKALRVSMPSPFEQQAVAAALNDADALIASVDALVAKKRDLKQAAMQQLLTGKTRLPGFRGKWETKPLADLLEYEQPTKYLVNTSEYSEENDVPVLTAGKTFILGYTKETHNIFNSLPVIIFDDFTTATKYVTFPFKAKSSAMKLLKPRSEQINLRLIYELMQLIQFKLSDHKRYWISEYQRLPISIPRPDEQAAIVAVISDMDADIVALERKRDKARALKQGMMQELLTGRIRLV